MTPGRPAAGRSAPGSGGKRNNGAGKAGGAKAGGARTGRGKDSTGAGKAGFAKRTGSAAGKAGGSKSGGAGRRSGGTGQAVGSVRRQRPNAGAGVGPPAPSATKGRRPEKESSAKADGLGGDQVEGRQAVRELLIAGRRRVQDVWLADGTDPAPVLAEITSLATEIGVPLRHVSRARLESVARTEAPQGVLAHAHPLPESDLDDLLVPPALPPVSTPVPTPLPPPLPPTASGGRNAPNSARFDRQNDEAGPFLLALDGVTDPRNLGALLRSAEGAGVTGVVLPRHRAVHVTPATTKAAAGAIEYLPMALVGGMAAAVARARSQGLWVIGLDPGGAQNLFDLRCGRRAVMVVVGAEGKGLSRLVRERCDVVAHIPLKGSVASLNAAVAGAMALFEVARNRSAGGPH